MVPVIAAFTDAIPSIQSIPGVNYLSKAKGERTHDAQKVNNAIEQVNFCLIYLNIVKETQ